MEEFREEGGRLVSGPVLPEEPKPRKTTTRAKLLISLALPLLLFGAFVGGRVTSPTQAPQEQKSLVQLQVESIRNGCIPVGFASGVGKESQLGQLTQATAAQVTEIKLTVPDGRNVEGHVYRVPEGSGIPGVYVGIITLERCLSELPVSP
jgi:hypothetical protein